MSDASETRLLLASREHSNTLWVEGAYREGFRPDDLFSDFTKAGWSVEEYGLPVQAYDDEWNRLPYSEFDFHINRMGTGLFGGWSPDEEKRFRAEARKIMRKHGFTRVPIWRKTLQDMI